MAYPFESELRDREKSKAIEREKLTAMSGAAIGGADAVRALSRREIPGLLSEVHEQAARLGKRVSELAARLIPVLGKEAVNSCGFGEVPAGTEFGSSLAGLLTQLRNIESEIDQIETRLEL